MLDYKLELLISFLRILLPFLAITFVSFFAIKALKISDFLEKIILLFLFDWFQIVLSIEILSLFKKVSLVNLAIFHLVCVITCIIISIVKKLNLRLNIRNIWTNILNFLKNIEINKVILIIIVFWIIVILGTTLFTGVIAPPGNYDSLTYHLARAAFWIQNHSINHYTTWAQMQNSQPINGEILLLWIMLITKSDNIAFLSQWVALFIILLGIYKILRLINFSKAVSLFTSAVFITFDIVILEATSTQNDLIVVCFALLSTIFILKAIKNNLLNLKYLLISGLTLGLMIGTKGTSYLFVPGIALILFLFGKNNKLKFIKIGYLLLFSISGIILLAAYNFIENYLLYSNFFSPKEFIGLISIDNPDIKTFISNVFRHITSFYQYYYIDWGTVGTALIKANISLHDKLGITVDSFRTTFSGSLFAYSPVKLNYDESYFGPVFFFFVMPSIFYSFISFLALRVWSGGKELVQKYKDSLKIYLIGLVFFIGYNYIFVWQPFAGRLLLGFPLFIMPVFAITFEFFKNIKFKKVFNILVAILFSLCIVSSYFPLFKADYINLSKYDLSIEYKDRRFDFMNSSNNLAISTFGDKYNLGLILKEGDAVYLLFGDKYNHELKYISAEDWNEKDVKEILDANSIDGILINLDLIEFSNGILTPFVGKIADQQLLRIDKSNFEKYIKSLSGCQLINDIKEKGITVKVLNDDPSFETTFPFDFKDTKSIIMSLKITTTIIEAGAQVFYKTNISNYNEKNSERLKLVQGENNLFIKIDDIQRIKSIRIDPINVKSDCIINEIVFFSPKSINYVKNENFILIYK